MGYNDGLRSPPDTSPTEQAKSGSPPTCVYWIAFGPFALIIMLAGLRTTFTGQSVWERTIGLAIGSALAFGFFWLARKPVVKVLKVFRLMRSRCMNCGYSVEGSINATCPECGKDPVELKDGDGLG